MSFQNTMDQNGWKYGHWQGSGAPLSGNYAGFPLNYTFDMNGDGLPDRIQYGFNYNTGRYFVIVSYNQWGKKGSGRLKRCINPAGSSETYTYKQVGKPGYKGTHVMGIVLASITVDDGFGNKQITSLDYNRGEYDYKKREFRGFGEVNKTMPDGTLVRSTYMTDETYQGHMNWEGTFIGGRTLQTKEYRYTSMNPFNNNTAVKYVLLGQEVFLDYDPVISYAGEITPWAVNISFAVGDLCSYNGNIYQCLQAHTVYDPNWTPPGVFQRV
jgi:hypothetical protein